jgi:hypothetical protein
MRRIETVAAALALSALTACHSVGPPGVVRDRFDYGEAISRSWKDQMLLNLVKLRYADAPVFLDVSSVISQYALQAQLSATGSFPSGGLVGSGATVGATGQWADRPIVTFQPLSGAQFTKSLLTSIPPSAVMDLVQAGWPVDITFRVAVRSVNGIQAGSRNRLIGQAEDPRFGQVLADLRRLQQSGGISVRVEKKGKDETTLLVLSRPIGSEETQARSSILETLGLDAETREFKLSFGALPESNKEIALLTRSMLEILADLSFDVEVPPEHERDGRAGQPLPPEIQKRTGFHISSGKDRPSDTFAAVHYEGYWFWIDDRDFSSKRAMSFMLVLTALAETGTPIPPPAVTISTGQ